MASKKDSVISADLHKFLEKRIRVKFLGGREVAGMLKGYDTVLNLVLDGTRDYLRDPNDPNSLSGETRELGICVCKGAAIQLICPADSIEAIPNPFIQQPDM